MNAFSFAHLSDVHLPFVPRLSLPQRLSKRQLSAWSWRRRRAFQRPEILEALRCDLRRYTPDHIVITGDVTNFSLPEEFRQASAWLEELAPPERISVVPGNHDALVPVPEADGLGRWTAWTHHGEGWPYVHRRGEIAFIGVSSALPTSPLLASGRIGRDQLARLQSILRQEAALDKIRVVMLHHPIAEGAISARKALVDRAELRAVLKLAGAELVLHGHARNARLDPVPGPHGPIPCVGIPSSSALANRRDEIARWHRVRLQTNDRSSWAEVLVRQWSADAQGFVDAACYELCLPRARSTIPLGPVTSSQRGAFTHA